MALTVGRPTVMAAGDVLLPKWNVFFMVRLEVAGRLDCTPC